MSKIKYPFGSLTAEFDVEEVKAVLGGHAYVDVRVDSQSVSPVIPLLVPGGILLLDLRGEIPDPVTLNAMLNCEYGILFVLGRARILLFFQNKFL